MLFSLLFFALNNSAQVSKTVNEMQVFYSPRNLEEVYMFLFKLKNRQKKQTLFSYQRDKNRW